MHVVYSGKNGCGASVAISTSDKLKNIPDPVFTAVYYSMHWASISKVVGSILTVVRHIFQLERKMTKSTTNISPNYVHDLIQITIDCSLS